MNIGWCYNASTRACMKRMHESASVNPGICGLQPLDVLCFDVRSNEFVR